MISISNDDFNMEISAVTADIFRVRYSREKLFERPLSELLEMKERKSPNSREYESGQNMVLETSGLRAEVCPENGTVTWSRPDGTLLLEEGIKEFIKIPVTGYTTGGEEPVIERVKTVDGERNFIKNLREIVDHEAYQGRIHFEFADDEGIYGLGQAEEGVLNKRGHVHYMYQHNMRIPMPMFVSSRLYGIFFDAACLMTFNDDANGSYIFFDTIDQLEYYFVVGASMDDVIAGFRELTGDASMLPKWAFGYIQSKEQYYSAKELRDVVRRYRELDVPIDCVVQDWNSWAEDMWGQKSLDPKRYSDMEEMTDEIHDMNAHTMISIWPNMNSCTEDYDELYAAGKMLRDFATYDAFDEEARRIYWKQVKRGLFDRGFDSFWCDSTEPFSGPDWSGEMKREPWVRYDIVGREHKKYLPPEKANIYSLLHAKGMFENRRKDDPDGRMLNLTRSGYAASQRYGAVLWSGDITGSWKTLKEQIAEGLSMGLSGYPYWTLDAGGFFTVGKKWQNRGCRCNDDPTGRWFWKGEYDEGVADRGYRELYVRFLQLACFLPMFRSHGTDTPREIWNFGKKGEPFYDAIEKCIKLRYALIPYIYSLAGAVRLERSIIMRSLIFDFPADEMSQNMDTEFMFGRNILVCPVTQPMYYVAGDKKIDADKKAVCYLPAGCEWYDFYTGEKYPGGSNVTVDAPIDVIPLFVRSGSIIPMEKKISYANEKPDEPLEVHVWPGADGSFTLYDDDGESCGYERGEYVRVRFTYDDAKRKLTVMEKEGGYPGMREGRRMEIYLGNSLSGSIEYDGGQKEITFA